MRLPKERTGKSPLAEEEDITHTHGERETQVVRQKRTDLSRECERDGRYSEGRNSVCKPLLLATSVRYRGSRSISPGSARERLRPGLLLSALVAAAAAATAAAAAAAAAAAIAAVVVAAIPRARLARELQRPAAHCFTPF
ncbi:hypothetical protein HN011_004956 [Eciton burchellii]|nr:hypothetical protein HN011_004956 [Eciton burchellii]